MSRHRYDWVALSFGALFLAVAANWAAHDRGLVNTTDLALLVPIVLILVGVLGIVASLTTVGRRKDGPADPRITAGPAEPDPETEPTQPIEREQGSPS